MHKTARTAIVPAPAPARAARPRSGAWHKRRPDFDIGRNAVKPWQAYTIPMGLLRAAMIFAGNGDVRYYLNGVLVEPTPDGKAIFVVATDGHRMLVLRHTLDAVLPEHQRRQFILNREDLAGVLKLKGDSLCLSGIEKPHANAPTMRAQVGTLIGAKKGFGLEDDKVHLLRCIDGRFPDWQKTLQPHVFAYNDTKKTVAAAGMVEADYRMVEANFKYLDDCRAAAAYLSANGRKSGRFYNECYAMHSKFNHAYLVTFPQNKDALAIIMGLKSSDQTPDIPAWLSEMHPEAPAKA